MDDLQIRQSRNCPSGFQWYSCSLVGNNFAGCCAVDPCNPDGGCPLTASPPTATQSATSVTTTSLSSSALTGTSTDPSSSTLTTSSINPTIAFTSSAATTSATTAGATPSARPSVTPASTTTGGQSAAKEPIDAIVGAAIGGFLGLLVILALIACMFYRRRRQQAKRRSATVTRRKSMEPLHGDEGQSMFAPFGGKTQRSQCRRVKAYNRTGFYRGTDDHHGEKQSSEVPITISAPDGRAYHYLDNDSPESSPVKNRISQLDGSPISELADTSPSHPHGFVAQPQYIAYSPARISTRVSPITPTCDGNLQSQHTMSWNKYDASESSSPPSNLTSNASPKTRANSPDPRTWICN